MKNSNALRVLAPLLVTTLLLTGCSLFAWGQPPAPPPSADSLIDPATETPIPTATFTPAPTTAADLSITPTAQPGQRSSSPASPGELLYLQAGRLQGIQPDGSSERTVADFGGLQAGREARISPDGRYVALDVSAQELIVFDTQTGSLTTLENQPGTLVSAFTWTPDSTALVYQRITLEGAELSPSRVEVRRAPMPPASANPETLTDVRLADSPTAYSPRIALTGGLVLLTEFSGGDPDAAGSPLRFIPGVGVVRIQNLPDGVTFWSQTVDGARVLVTRDATDSPGSILFGAEILDNHQLGDLRRISPEGDEGEFLFPQYDAERLRVAALRFTLQPDGSRLGEVVVMTPPGNLERPARVVVVQIDPAGEPAGLAWYGVEALIVTQIEPGAALPSLWFVPVDGSAPRRLSSGSIPLVIPPPAPAS